MQIKRIHSTLFQVNDLKRTADFYKKLGFEVSENTDALRIIFGDYRLAFMVDKKEESNSSLQKGVGLHFYFEVENANDFFKTIKEKGINVENEPENKPWEKCELTVSDPDGYKLVFFSKI
ncbi:VOC family protein [Patescibacteria group bacterium]|nr:VOC family protein [Patescibacteria group bacterium]